MPAVLALNRSDGVVGGGGTISSNSSDDSSLYGGDGGTEGIDSFGGCGVKRLTDVLLLAKAGRTGDGGAGMKRLTDLQLLTGAGGRIGDGRGGCMGDTWASGDGAGV